MEQIKNPDADINQGQTKDKVTGLYLSLEKDPQVNELINELRRGYPDKPFAEQSHGEIFRQAADQIADRLAALTLGNINAEPENITLLLPWRAALIFGTAYKKAGVDNFAHISSKRNEKTLATEVDYEHYPEIDQNSHLIISDPMLATGNTIIDAIARMKNKGLKPENIVINAIVAAPIGVAKIKEQYPEIKIIIGFMDDYLDDKGYIVPGLGDFGDKYFEGLDQEYVDQLISDKIIEPEAGEKLLTRMRQS